MTKSDTSMRDRSGGRCPYTDEPCESWECVDCEVEAEEGRWLEELDKEEENE